MLRFSPWGRPVRHLHRLFNYLLNWRKYKCVHLERSSFASLLLRTIRDKRLIRRARRTPARTAQFCQERARLWCARPLGHKLTFHARRAALSGSLAFTPCAHCKETSLVLVFVWLLQGVTALKAPCLRWISNIHRRFYSICQLRKLNARKKAWKYWPIFNIDCSYINDEDF